MLQSEAERIENAPSDEPDDNPFDDNYDDYQDVDWGWNDDHSEDTNGDSPR